MNNNIENILYLSKKQAKKLGYKYIYSYHVILAILSYDNEISLFLNDLGINYKRYLSLIRKNKYHVNPYISNELKNILNDLDDSNDIDNLYNLIISDNSYALKFLKRFGLNKEDLIYKKFSYGKLLKTNNKLIGREKEINKIIEVLTRKNKNNPLLIGPSGVGKTSIIEELSNRLNKDLVPLNLRGRRIYLIDISSIVAGTKYRGEFEEKLNNILNKIDENTIIYIDEIHTIIGAGSSEGGIDASQILKPYLDRNKIKLIGSTTIKEYKKYLKKDPALDRRFEKIIINEPNIKETKNILLNIKDSYEEYYKIKIDKNLINNIVDLAHKYLLNKNDPDRSLDLLDNTCSYIKNKNDNYLEYNIKNKELIEIHKLKEKYQKENNHKKLKEYQNKEEKLMKIVNNLEMNYYKDLKITRKDILEVLNNYYEINTKTYTKKEFNKYFKDIYLKDNLLDRLYNIYKRLKKENISLLLSGPSGVGKSLIIKRLSNISSSNTIKLNMADYDYNSINKLIGSPPGYSGYEEEAILEKLKPGSILILDEIDKCSSNILNLFLGILDDHYFINAKGEKIDLNISIFMTSNAGSNSIGFNNKLLKELNTPFLARIDEIININSFDKEDLEILIKKKSRKKLSKNQINKIIEESNYKEYNARGIEKVLNKV